MGRCICAVLLVFSLASVANADVSFSLVVPDQECPVGGECVLWGTITYTGDETLQFLPIDETDTEQGLWAPTGSVSCTSDTLERGPDFNCGWNALVAEPLAELFGLTVEPGFVRDVPLAFVSFASGVPPGSVATLRTSFDVEGYHVTWNGFEVYDRISSGDHTFEVTALEPDFRTTVEAEMIGPSILELDFSIEAPAPATWFVWLWPFQLWAIPIPAVEPVSLEIDLPFPAGSGSWVVVTALADGAGVQAFDFAVFDT